MRSLMTVGMALVALTAAAPAFAAGGSGSKAAAAIKFRELATERAGVKINLYEKWVPTEEANQKKFGRVILLVHGATWSSRCTFDPVPGFSMMDALAEAGYDVFAVDLHGYGKSGKTERDWTEASSAAQDIDAAVDYIRALRWVERVHLFGFQWGAQPVGLFATSKPNKVGKVVLFGMRYNIVERKGEPAAQYRFNNMQTASLKPDDGDLDPEFARKRAQMCADADPQSPNGALRDLTRASSVEPGSLRAPTMLVMGERENDQALMQDRVAFFQALAAREKWFVVLPGLGKYANYERNRARFESALISFLNQP